MTADIRDIPPIEISQEGNVEGLSYSGDYDQEVRSVDMGYIPPHDKLSLLLAVAKLKDFIRDLLDMSNYGDIDGGEFQDLCVEYGVLVPTQVEKPCHPELCQCAEYDPDGFPMECFRRAKWLEKDNISA